MVYEWASQGVGFQEWAPLALHSCLKDLGLNGVSDRQSELAGSHERNGPIAERGAQRQQQRIAVRTGDFVVLDNPH